MIKYQFPIEYEWRDILYDLVNKNKYLALSHAMRSVRGDWNNGCGEVSDALDKFIIENDTDKEIEIAILRAINYFHEDRDGRIFRDCEWNYSKLFTLVDNELYEDYLTVQRNCLL